MKITLDGTFCDAIYYTTDGTVPSDDFNEVHCTRSSEYVNGTTLTVQAFATAPNEYKVGREPLVHHTASGGNADDFAPAAGAVAANTTVTIATTTPGAAIYFTVDGTAPNLRSPEYSQPISLSRRRQ